jgi:hypothetical protein
MIPQIDYIGESIGEDFDNAKHFKVSLASLEERFIETGHMII